jgi:hypothetical protein
MTMKDDKKQYTSKIMMRGKYSTMGLRKMTWIYFVSYGAPNRVDWRATMVVALIAKTEPPLGGRSTFLAKREC